MNEVKGELFVAIHETEFHSYAGKKYSFACGGKNEFTAT
jgi:hypothetical protein